MSKFAAADTRPDPRLSRLLWQAAALAALPWWLAPSMYGTSPWLGKGALWLILVPTISLLVLYRHSLRAAFSAALEPTVARRRRLGRRGQARRASQRPRHRSLSPRAA